MMVRSEYDRLKSIIDKELSGSNFQFFDDSREKYYYYSFGKIRSSQLKIPEKSTEYTGIDQGVWIDIFPYDNLADDPNDQVDQITRVRTLHKKFVYFLFTHPTDMDSAISKIVKSCFRLFNIITYRVNPFLNQWNKQRNIEMKKYNNTSTEYMSCLSDNMPIDYYSSSKLRKSELLDVIDHSFEGHSFLIIRHYHEFLTNIYGDYMQLPPIEEQVSVHNFIKL